MVSTDDWSKIPSENTTVDGVFIGENCPPGNVNNAIRSVMAGVKSKVDSIDASIPVLDPTLSAIAVLEGTADTFPYFTGTDVAALATVTPFARTLLDDTDAAAALSTLGAIGGALSGNGTSGKLKLSNGFTLTWRTVNVSAGSAPYTYGDGYTYSSWARAWVQPGGTTDTDVSIWITSVGTSSAAIANAEGTTQPCQLFSIGV